MRVHAVVDSVDAARAAVEAGATVVQLRVKAATDEVVRRGRPFETLELDRRGVTFVVNDDVDAAIELRADGVHLGQSDGGAERARAAGLLLGRSATTLEEALAAEGDYLGVGPVWETPSKHDAAPALGVDGLAEICAAVATPVVAIGGIDAGNAAACIRAGAVGVAVIRAADDPALRRAVDEALGHR
jgi:thiamine-phosphate pyrophosphorylase